MAIANVLRHLQKAFMNLDFDGGDSSGLRREAAKLWVRELTQDLEREERALKRATAALDGARLDGSEPDEIEVLEASVEYHESEIADIKERLATYTAAAKEG